MHIFAERDVGMPEEHSGSLMLLCKIREAIQGIFDGKLVPMGEQDFLALQDNLLG